MSEHAIMYEYQNISHVKPDIPDLTGCSVYCKLPKFDWYWGDIKLSEAEALAIQNPGTFIIRASQGCCSILCITFLSEFTDSKATKVMSWNTNHSKSIFRNNHVTHMRLLHHKGLFSLDKRNYVPLEDLPQHCASFGRVNELFKAHALKRDATRRLVLSSVCEIHSWN